MSSGSEYFIGLDLGGSFLKYALGTRDGELIESGQLVSHGDGSQDDIFSVIFSAIESMQELAASQNGYIAGIGLGSPGAIHFEECRLIGFTPNLPNWKDAPIRQRIEEKFNIPVWADNDANIAAFGEARFGAARGKKNVICATLGTGIGGGIIIDGDIYRGAHYAGAEIGHMMIVHNGLPCDCGGIGCFEKYASATAMMREYNKKIVKNGVDQEPVTSTKPIFQKAKEGQREAIEAIEETIEFIGTGFANLVNIFNPEVLVVGGGVAQAGQAFIDKIDHATRKRAMNPPCRELSIVEAELGNKAGVYGAIALAAEMVEKKIKLASF